MSANIMLKLHPEKAILCGQLMHQSLEHFIDIDHSAEGVDILLVRNPLINTALLNNVCELKGWSKAINLEGNGISNKIRHH